MSDIKKEFGVMIMKDGLAFGVDYEDGHSTSYGWIDPCNAPIHNPKFCKQPSDGAPPNWARDASKGKLVPVVRTTTVEVTE